ncbi:MAG: hypothetical protein AB8B48_08075 [Pseudomonadales bacterium]
MPVHSRSSTLVTICLENTEALQLAMPLILSFAAVGSPPCVLFDAEQPGLISAVPSQNQQLDQLTEFGVSEIFTNEHAKLYLERLCPALTMVTIDAARIRTLHTQAHAIYAF